MVGADWRRVSLLLVRVGELSLVSDKERDSSWVVSRSFHVNAGAGSSGGVVCKSGVSSGEKRVGDRSSGGAQ
jgi:hypothetical protein